MSEPKIDEVIKHAVSRSFEALQSMEMRTPEDAGVQAANIAFTRTLQREVERKARRRQPNRSGKTKPPVSGD